MVISVITNGTICRFQGINAEIVEAYIHLMMEYLIVTCDDGAAYVFNMMS
jgi:hypothetical protein